MLFLGLSVSLVYCSYWRATLIHVEEGQYNNIGVVNQVACSALNAEGRSLEFHRDTVYLVNFTGYYCLPCRHKNPAIDDLRERFRNKPFRLITVHCFEPYHVFRQNYIHDLYAYHDEKNSLAKFLKVESIPTEVLISPRGTECCRIEGYNPEQHDNYLENRSTIIRDQINSIRKK